MDTKKVSGQISLTIIACCCATILIIGSFCVWLVIRLVQGQELYHVVPTLVLQLLLLGLVCGALCAVVAHRVGQYLSKPVHAMVEATRQVSSGNYNVHVDLEMQNEISELGHSFNEMVGNIGALNNELMVLAYYDPLTGMGNKNYFERHAAELLCNSSVQYAYVLLDINKFKIVNDQFGMQQGDSLLRHVATVLGQNTEDGELAARFNADCFHLLLHHHNREELEQRLNQIAQQIATFKLSKTVDYKLSMGFGVYVVEESSPYVSLIGDRAKLALDKVKGSHAVAIHFYNDNIRNKILEEQEIENLMEAALQNGEFEVYLQPKVSPYTGRIVGSEALVRWVHPTKGIVQPDQFIHVFERNGFIAQMDRYVLDRVCQLLRSQLDAGLSPMPVSVNQSRQYINLIEYLPGLEEALAQYHIPSNLVELEITETAFVESQSEMIDIVGQLHNMGFKVSLDDFGSGYSSFNMLQDILVDVLKIDKNFFRDSVHSDRGKKIVASIVAMAHELGMRVVAEGVETSEQVDFLMSCGCDFVQGFYYARPMPLAELDMQWREQSALLQST